MAAAGYFEEAQLTDVEDRAWSVNNTRIQYNTKQMLFYTEPKKKKEKAFEIVND